MAERRKRGRTGLQTLEVQTVDEGEEAPTPKKENVIKTRPIKKKGATVRARNTMSMTPSFEDFVKWTKNHGVAGLGQLFRNKLALSQPAMKPAPSFEANMDKNRFPDVICLEATRVKLEKENPTDTDYIHANYVKFPGYDRRYICTQGPLPHTVEDFWRMVWQEKSPIVVNLTSCCKQEKGQSEPKGLCWQYWPLAVGNPMQCGRFSVMTKKVDEDLKLNIYVIEVLPEGCSNSHVLRLIHATEWPDKGVMRTRYILKLIKQIYLADTLAPKEPIIIHCGAGIGRTGTLVLIDYTLFRLTRLGKFHDLEGSFALLRMQRASSIQQEGQFVYIVVTILRYIAVAVRTPALLALADELNEQFKKAYPQPEKQPTPTPTPTSEPETKQK